MFPPVSSRTFASRRLYRIIERTIRVPAKVETDRPWYRAMPRKGHRIDHQRLLIFQHPTSRSVLSVVTPGAVVGVFPTKYSSDIVRGHPEIHLGIKMVPVASGLRCELQTLGLLSVRLQLGIIRAVRPPSAKGELRLSSLASLLAVSTSPVRYAAAAWSVKHDPDAGTMGEGRVRPMHDRPTPVPLDRAQPRHCRRPYSNTNF